MCVLSYPIRNLDKYNWDGDMIIHDCIVPSARPVAGFTSKKEYEIDIREFLVTENNAVTHKTLHEDIEKFVKEEIEGDWDFFKSRDQGSFDYRTNIIVQWVSEHIAYKLKENDFWLFPDETLKMRQGDCEDRAFLLASLILASGISAYNVRVVLGKVKSFHVSTNKLVDKFDHMWVMYKNESGRWLLIEPLYMTIKNKSKVTSKPIPKKLEQLSQEMIYEYIPQFLFNDSHLWQIGEGDLTKQFKDHVKLRKAWKKFDPTFAGFVHRSIIDEVFDSYNGKYDRIKNALHREFLWLTAYVEKIDMPGSYHPFDHFDNAYIEEGWKRIFDRLNNCMNPSAGDRLHQFALAVHAISDFYAHSSYAHFGKVVGGKLVTYYDENNNITPLQRSPDYSAALGFDITKLSKNPTCNHTPEQRIATWKGKIISGRYDQPGDSQSFFERITRSLPKELLNAPDFKNRKALPHHNEIAVDSASDKSNKLYTKESDFKYQFELRKDAAVRHIRMAFEKYGRFL
jgi:hypothetical protein